MTEITTWKISEIGQDLFDRALRFGRTLTPVRLITGQLTGQNTLDPQIPSTELFDIDTDLSVPGESRTIIYDRVSPDVLLYGVILDVGAAYFVGNAILYFRNIDTTEETTWYDPNGTNLDEVPALYLEFDKAVVKPSNIALTVPAEIQYPNVAALFQITPRSNLTRYAYSAFRNGTDYYLDLLRAADDLQNRTFIEPINRLAKQARGLRGLERRLLLRYVRQLGFNTRFDVQPLPDGTFRIRLTDADLERIGQFLPLHYPSQQSADFVKFVGYVLQSVLEVIQLWSFVTPEQPYRYAAFETEPLGLRIWEGGEWFPTSHYAISYDHETADTERLRDLLELFYQMAPIHIVVERIIANLFGDSTLRFIARGVMLVNQPSETKLPSDAQDLIPPAMRRDFEVPAGVSF